MMENNNVAVYSEKQIMPINTLCGRNAKLLNVKVGGIRGCIQKFQDWPPGARTANGTAPCRWVQLYRYFVGQSNESSNPFCWLLNE